MRLAGRQLVDARGSRGRAARRRRRGARRCARRGRACAATGRCRWSPCRWLIRTTSTPAQVARVGQRHDAAQQPDGVGEQRVGEHGAAGQLDADGRVAEEVQVRARHPASIGRADGHSHPAHRTARTSGRGSRARGPGRLRRPGAASSSTVRSCGWCGRAAGRPRRRRPSRAARRADAAGDADQAEARWWCARSREHLQRPGGVVAGGQRGQVDAHDVERHAGQQREDAVAHAVVVQAEADAGAPGGLQLGHQRGRGGQQRLLGEGQDQPRRAPGRRLAARSATSAARPSGVTCRRAG